MAEAVLGISSDQNQRAWALLSRIVTRQEDRFTGARTFGIPLFAEATNSDNRPVCHLLATASPDGTAVAALSFTLTTKGCLTLPPPGSTVEWLAPGYRGTSVVLKSGSETVSRTFRVGTDVIPGPLFLFVSTPIAISRSSGSALIHLPTELLEVMPAPGP